MDRRHDPLTRDRVAELELRYRHTTKRLWTMFTTLAAGMTAVAVVLGLNVQAQQREGSERRDETCVLFERHERAAVDQLRRTYEYLKHPSPELGDLNRLVVAQLPQVERAARASRAPRYCDPDDVGLPGKRPVMPTRPKNLR